MAEWEKLVKIDLQSEGIYLQSTVESALDFFDLPFIASCARDHVMVTPSHRLRNDNYLTVLGFRLATSQSLRAKVS